jgi:hypothetical protein
MKKLLLGLGVASSFFLASFAKVRAQLLDDSYSITESTDLLIGPGRVNTSFDFFLEGPAAFCGGAFGLIFYFVFAFALYKIAKRIGEAESAWWAFIPVLNFFLLFKLAGVSCLFFLLFFIPFVNLIVMLYIWIQILEKLGKPTWQVLLFLIPVVNLVYLLMIAFESGDNTQKTDVSQGS